MKQLVYPSSRNGASAEQREWQRVVVIEDDYDGSKGATDVPGCILSLNSGIIRSRVNRREGDGPFQSAQTNASYLFGGQVDLYRKALSSPERQDVKTMDLEEFKTKCCIQLKKYDSPAAANSSTCCAVLNGLPQSGRVVADSGSAG